MAARLPFELLTLIVDDVAEQTFSNDINNPDTATLRNCALVSSQFTTLCQKHIFSRIRIPFHKPYAISILQQILDVDNPELGSYVKDLALITLSHTDTYQTGLDRIIRRCTQVVNLAIGCDGAQACIDWDRGMPENTRLALESVIHSPTCKTLLCYGFRIPLSIFLNPPHTCAIESFVFTNKGGVTRGTVGCLDKLPVGGSSYGYLRFLSVRPSFMELLLTATFPDGRYMFDFTNLDTLRVDHTTWRVTQTNLTIEMLSRATSLRSLGLDLSCKSFMTLLWNTAHQFASGALDSDSGYLFQTHAVLFHDFD